MPGIHIQSLQIIDHKPYEEQFSRAEAFLKLSDEAAAKDSVHAFRLAVAAVYFARAIADQLLGISPVIAVELNLVPPYRNAAEVRRQGRKVGASGRHPHHEEVGTRCVEAQTVG